MNYKELFSAINCQRLVIIEDDFQQTPYSKNRVIYDIARMNLNDRKYYLEEVSAISSKLCKDISTFLKAFDNYFDAIENWDDCILNGDILSSLPSSSEEEQQEKSHFAQLFNCIEDSLLQEKAYSIGAKYGIGVNHPSYFDELYKEYIAEENRLQSIRIYTDFSSYTQSLFEKDLALANTENSIVCVIDNVLKDERRAGEIIDEIEKQCQPNRKNIIGCIFSSKSPLEKISEAVYFEYTSKEQGNLEASIARSAYNFFISELKTETISGLEQAFTKALKNKSIAFFLSQKAYSEGTSEYQVINDWIKLLSISSNNNLETVKRLTCLSRVINSLEDTEEIPDPELQNLNTLEAFDYTINEFYLPIASGDIFKNSKGEWFVLIGQDCDMARRPDTPPRNALAELLPAIIRNQTDFVKWANDLKTASIFNFKETINSDSTNILVVDYQHRKYLSNEIISLCGFNETGECKISLSQKLSVSQAKLMPKFIVDYYKRLQDYFSSVKTIRNNVGDAFDLIISEDFSKRLISLNDFKLDSNLVSFDLTRVCRLSHNYVFYLYKLYLEYRGRHPFQTINLARQANLSLPITENKKRKSGLSMSFQCIPTPDNKKPKECPWIVKVSEINRICNYLGQNEIDEQGDEIKLTDKITTKSLKNSTKNLIIEKCEHTIDFKFKN